MVAYIISIHVITTQSSSLGKSPLFAINQEVGLTYERGLFKIVQIYALTKSYGFLGLQTKIIFNYELEIIGEAPEEQDPMIGIKLNRLASEEELNGIIG